MKFSIITPSFNQLDWLDLCIRSVADQNCSPVLTEQARDKIISKKDAEPLDFAVEHIIQDGGSSGFDEFSEQMSREFPDTHRYSLRFYSEKDYGMYDAINKGFAKAKGDWVAWLNCDEQYLEGTLNFLYYYLMENSSIEVLFGDAILLDPDCQPYSYRRIVMPSMEYLCTISPDLFSCASFFSEKVITSGISFDTRWKILGDAVYFAEIFKSGFRVSRVPVALAAFAMTGKNLSEDSLACFAEWKEWRQLQGQTFRTPRWMLVWGQRIKKLLAGSYIIRNLELALFAHGQHVRKNIRDTLGFTWVRNS